MKKTIEIEKVDFLREKYLRFVYKAFSYKVVNGDLKIVFNFIIGPNIKFKPEIIIKNINKKRLKQIGPTPQQAGYGVKDRVLENLVFHLGLMEIPSYWKATCSPVIEIQAGYLNKEQINWWKDLIMNGMGQFFYENKINFTKPNFLKITSLQRPVLCKAYRDPSSVKLKNRVLVPVGGGKDSIVTLEKLKKQKRGISAFMVNPTKAAEKIIKVSGIKKKIVVRRTIDKKLLELNKKGYLNGHTPITAVLSFLSVFCAILFDYKNIAFSNEKSANEGNVKYLGKIINHQWSKSSEFEKKFRSYCRKYLAKEINYFSYLRKYTELEIAKMFTKYPKYFSVFSSCNVMVAKRLKKRWCGNCPKCLFVYAILYPFLEKEQLLKIFGTDIFENKKLLPIMYQLMGKKFVWAHSHTRAKPAGVARLRFSHAKPFECVGTKKESRLAFELSFKKALRQAQDKPLPWLLTRLQ